MLYLSLTTIVIDQLGFANPSKTYIGEPDSRTESRGVSLTVVLCIHFKKTIGVRNTPLSDKARLGKPFHPAW